MKQRYFYIITVIMLISSCTQNEPQLKVGLVADPQYADKPDQGKRYYSESIWKLEEAIETFNHGKVDFVQNLGDLIDEEWKSFDAILPVYDQLIPGTGNYHLLGNHDFAVDSAHLTDVLEKLSMPDYYYSYSKKGWRFIVLDATDYSFYSNAIHHHGLEQINSYFENTKGKANHKSWNSAIGKEQQNWLEQELDSANVLNQKVIVFSHLPLRPLQDPHNLWNDYEIIRLIEKHSNVVAFINGHNHAGAYVYKNGIHYITIAGMVDTHVSSYGILELYSDSLIVKGYGNQKTLELKMEPADR